ncbi:MAG: ABC transporter substrate-binding protein, partial [Pyrinomonadaceae bacterium]
KQGDLLWGDFAGRLPNIKYYDADAGKRDFGTPIEGLEAPWQRAQFVFAYDTARFSDPPKSIVALGEWIKRNPGRFTYIAPPDFTGSVFLRHILFHFGGGAEKFQSFDEDLYKKASAKTFAFLNEIKPFLWRGGETYASSTVELDRLFANREIDFAFAYGANFASDRIKRGEYPASVRTFILDAGTIGNYNFLTIPFNAANPAGAMAVINYFMSPEFQIEQSRALGSVYPHKPDTLSEQQRRVADALERGPATLGDDELAEHLIPEADSEYLERLEKDWRSEVLLK